MKSDNNLKIISDKEIFERAAGGCEQKNGFFSIFPILLNYLFGNKSDMSKKLRNSIRARQDELTTDHEIETKFERPK